MFDAFAAGETTFRSGAARSKTHAAGTRFEDDEKRRYRRTCRDSAYRDAPCRLDRRSGDM
jgi:hypothetical protein